MQGFKLNTCQTLMAIGVLGFIERRRLGELVADGSSLSSIGNEFYSDHTDVDLEGDIRILDLSQTASQPSSSSFVIIAEDDFDGDDEEPNDGAMGLVISAIPDEPGFTGVDKVFRGGAWVDAEQDEDNQN